MDIRQGWLTFTHRRMRVRHYFVETTSLCGEHTLKPFQHLELVEERDYSMGNCRECAKRLTPHRQLQAAYVEKMKEQDPHFELWVNPEQ